MKITEVRVHKLQGEGKTKAFCSVTIDDSLVIHDLRVVEGERDLFVSMPSRRLPTGERRDIAHPLNNQVRAALHTAVLEAYAKA